MHSTHRGSTQTQRAAPNDEKREKNNDTTRDRLEIKHREKYRGTRANDPVHATETKVITRVTGSEKT
jgi:hypothetical protein